MLGLVFMSALVTALAGSSTFTLTASQRQQTYMQMHARERPQWFSTASEAAYAAALDYGQNLLYEEIGAKIYVDGVGPDRRYSFGSVIHGEDDPQTGDAEIVYSMIQTDGHSAIAGLWHEHPTGQNWTTLFGPRRGRTNDEAGRLDDYRHQSFRSVLGRQRGHSGVGRRTRHPATVLRMRITDTSPLLLRRTLVHYALDYGHRIERFRKPDVRNERHNGLDDLALAQAHIECAVYVRFELRIAPAHGGE